jgi:hypothetical protein
MEGAATLLQLSQKHVEFEVSLEGALWADYMDDNTVETFGTGVWLHVETGCLNLRITPRARNKSSSSALATNQSNTSSHSSFGRPGI